VTRRCRRTSRRTIVEGPTRRREKADGGSRLVPTFRAERACPRGVSATKEEPVSRRQRARSARGAGLDGDGPSAVPRGDGRSATLGEMQSNCWTRFRGGSPNPTPGSGQTSPGPLSQDRSRSCPIRSFDQATAVTAALMLSLCEPITWSSRAAWATPRAAGRDRCEGRLMGRHRRRRDATA
jgi:hypothetical protein